MDFIGLARAVRSRAGLQGTGPSSVTSAAGPEAVIVQSVQDAWLDIQNEEVPNSSTCWKWMRTSATFLTTQGQKVYQLSDIFNPGYRFKKWMRDTMYITVDTKRSRVRYYEYDVFNYRFSNDTAENKISAFTIRPSDSAIIFNLPDGIYTIEIDYQKSPQELVSDTDVPEMPSHYHLVIMYSALEKFIGSYQGDSGSFQQFSYDNAKLYGSLLRSQMPKLKIKQRSLA